MPRRRVPTRRGQLAPPNERGTPGRVRRHIRNRQAPCRYGQVAEPDAIQTDREETEELESVSNEVLPSEYSESLQSSINPSPPGSHNESDTYAESVIREPTTPPISERQSTTGPNEAISLDDMRQLLRSHEQDIVDRVVLQLRTHNGIHTSPTLQANSAATPYHQSHQAIPGPTLNRITDLEIQLARLQAEQQLGRPDTHITREPRTYDPAQPQVTCAPESASGTVESVEILFPGVERSTLAQIIENRFKPTNIYRLLATEKERAEAQRTINIGGIEFEQSERDGKECDYRMGNFFKAWAAYSGILVKLAPYALQGELAISLFMYTMSLYDLLEKYTWDGVRAYHFQFHRKRIASGKALYLPQEWQQVDSELIASKCFAHPVLRTTWNNAPGRTTNYPRRSFDLPLRENIFSSGYPYQGAGPSLHPSIHERRLLHQSAYSSNTASGLGGITRALPPAPQPCQNWNYRECRTVNCRHQHLCNTCGGNHKATQCSQAGNAPSAPGQPNRLSSR